MKRINTRHWPEDEGIAARSLTVAAAIVGGAIIGGVASNSAASKGEKAANNATRQQAAAADAQTALGYEQLDFNKQVYADGAGARTAAEKRAQEVSDAQLASMRQNDAISKDYYDYSKNTFRPLEEGLVADAQSYDTAGRRMQAAAEASAGIENSFGSAQAATARAIGRTGGTVGGGRTAALMQDFALAKAKADAGATTSAVKAVETQGYARKMDAASLGRGLASSQATSASVATQAGNSSVSNAMQSVAAQQAGASTVNQGYSGASSSIGSAGSLYGQVANSYNQQASRSAQTWGAIGSAAGQYAGGYTSSASTSYPQMSSADASYYYSDEDMKTGTGKPIDGDKALEQIESLDIDQGWKYDTAKGGPTDGRQHDGPMAQEVRRRMGDRVAPGGKKIDIASMNGRLLGGMQAIARRLATVETKVERIAA